MTLKVSNIGLKGLEGHLVHGEVRTSEMTLRRWNLHKQHSIARET